MPEPTLADLEKAAKSAADKVENYQKEIAEKSGEYVAKLTKAQQRELSKLRKEADEAEARLKAAQAAATKQAESVPAPRERPSWFLFGLVALATAIAVLGVILVRNLLENRDTGKSEQKEAKTDGAASHVTADEAGEWLDISKDFSGQAEPGGPVSTTDIDDQKLAFIKALLVDRHFEAAVQRGYARTQPSEENPLITQANYGLWGYIFEDRDDSKVFVGEYTQFWMGRGFTQTGTYAGNGVILQDPSHVDLLWYVRNAVLRVNVGGSSKYPLPAASKDAVDTADLVAANSGKN